MRVGITGGAGFIGRWVVRACADAGHESLVLDHHRGGAPIDGAETMLGDVRDPTAMTELAGHVDGIIHLAAVLGTQETVANPRPAAETNIVGGLNALEAAVQYDLPLAYIGVGNHWMNSSYSITKTTVERFCSMFNADRGGRVNVVRAMNAYGPGQSVAAPFGPAKVRKITPSFVCRALCGMDLEVYGDGAQVSDMVWVGDVATALVRALEAAERGDVFDRVVEVGPGDHTTVAEVARLVRGLAGRHGAPPAAITHLPMRPGEIAGDRVVADTSTLCLVGLDPAKLRQLDDGMDETLRWFSVNEGVTWRRP